MTSGFQRGKRYRTMRLVRRNDVHNIDVVLFKEGLDKLSLVHEVIEYLSLRYISELWNARAKDDFITFQGKAKKSASEQSFVSGAEELLSFISTSDFKDVKSLIEGAKDYIKK